MTSASSITEVGKNAIANVYQRAVALDLLSQRQVAFAKLKQKGVLVLDAAANQISEQRYLQLKFRTPVISFCT